MDAECRSCSVLHFIAERTVGSSESNPVSHDCFQGRQITTENIPLLEDPPQLLRELLNGDIPLGRSFRENILKYNNALCMASVHAKWDNRGEGSLNSTRLSLFRAASITSSVPYSPILTEDLYSHHYTDMTLIFKRSPRFVARTLPRLIEHF